MVIKKEYDWTKQEKETYKPIDYKPLRKLYSEANLPITNPEARADYLAHKVLNFNYADELGMLVVLDEKGKAGALNHLEYLVIERHLENVENNRASKDRTLIPLSI